MVAIRFFFLSRKRRKREDGGNEDEGEKVSVRFKLALNRRREKGALTGERDKMYEEEVTKLSDSSSPRRASLIFFSSLFLFSSINVRERKTNRWRWGLS